jgi:hypothetical protein
MEPLVGPQLDVERMRKLLIGKWIRLFYIASNLTPVIDQFGYKPSDIVMLTDRLGGTEDIQPTYGNIVGSHACTGSFWSIHINILIDERT